MIFDDDDDICVYLNKIKKNMSELYMSIVFVCIHIECSNF